MSQLLAELFDVALQPGLRVSQCDGHGHGVALGKVRLVL
jgi:hypothetical protein